MDWINDNRDMKDVQFMIPTAWTFLETRLQEHPNEAREVDRYGYLPIHRVFFVSRTRDQEQNTHEAPLSLIELLIEMHADGLHFRDGIGNVALHHAAYHSCIDCFRAVLYNGNVEAPTTQNVAGYTPLHFSTSLYTGLAVFWELVSFNRECVNVQNGRNEAAFQLLALVDGRDLSQQQVFCTNAKNILLKLAASKR
jgi:hypothetical protein